MSDNSILTLIFLGVGVLFIVLSIPLILKRIPPNFFYGVRTNKTLSNESKWYEVNHFFGKDFLFVGVVIFLSAAVTGIFGESVNTDILAAIFVGVMFVLMGVAVFRCRSRCSD